MVPNAATDSAMPTINTTWIAAIPRCLLLRWEERFEADMVNQVVKFGRQDNHEPETIFVAQFI